MEVLMGPQIQCHYQAIISVIATNKDTTNWALQGSATAPRLGAELIYFLLFIPLEQLQALTAHGDN